MRASGIIPNLPIHRKIKNKKDRVRSRYVSFHMESLLLCDLRRVPSGHTSSFRMGSQHVGYGLRHEDYNAAAVQSFSVPIHMRFCMLNRRSGLLTTLKLQVTRCSIGHYY